MDRNECYRLTQPLSKISGYATGRRPLITQTDTHMMSSVSHYRRRRRRRAMWCGDVVTKLVGRRTRRKLLRMSQNDSLIGVEDLS